MKSPNRFLVALALAVYAVLATAAFNPGMSIEQIEAEINAQLAQGATLQQVAVSALGAGLDAGVVTAAMVTASGNAAGAVGAMVTAGAPIQRVVSASLNAGATQDAVRQGAIGAGVSPDIVNAAILTALAETATRPDSPSVTTPTGATGPGGGGIASPS